MSNYLLCLTVNVRLCSTSASDTLRRLPVSMIAYYPRSGVCTSMFGSHIPVRHLSRPTLSFSFALSLRVILLLVLTTPLGLSSSFAGAPHPTRPSTSLPNIVMIISDDQSWTDYGFMGHETIQTPHLDRLASRSAVFPKGYVPTALCRPSLMTMITGKYPHQHGVTGNDPAPNAALSSAQYNALREQLISYVDSSDTLPRLLGKQGYVSHQSGKWWEGNFSRGGFTAGMTRGFPQKGGRHGDDGLVIGRQGMKPVLDFVDDAAAANKPFFLWYAPFLPHTPHNPPKRLLDKYSQPGRPEELAKYFAMCEWFDETCGELLNHLDARKMTDNTIIVYVCDNGWIQATADNKPDARWKQGFAPRSKQSPYDGGTRTPIMFSWPGHFDTGIQDERISSVDILPTVLDAIGETPPAALPGLSLVPLLTGKGKVDRDYIYGESFAHDVADVKNPEASLMYRWVIRNGRKLLLTYDAKPDRYSEAHAHYERNPQLFDLDADPHEKINLAADHPAEVKELAALLQKEWPVKKAPIGLAP
ncbi:MAG: sulfatase [Planctomycetaceae bacterium]|nr:sulfatase [Planctomycetaceae bacterium]